MNSLFIQLINNSRQLIYKKLIFNQYLEIGGRLQPVICIVKDHNLKFSIHTLCKHESLAKIS